MIRDDRQPWRYGVENVIGDIHSSAIPTAVNRTILEYKQLRDILDTWRLWEKSACEVGCGFGRMLPLLKEFFDNVFGFERDDELAGIASQLNRDCSVFSFDIFFRLQEQFNLILTFTFLQHLNREDFNHVIKAITDRLPPGGHLLAVEEFYKSIDFAPLNLIHAEPRVIEATNPRKSAGTVMLFQKPYLALPGE